MEVKKKMQKQAFLSFIDRDRPSSEMNLRDLF